MANDNRLSSGYLPDGTAYFIRASEDPDDRVCFRLLVAVGSAMETEQQRGYAHLVEHMAFNGTPSYPGRGFDQYLATIDNRRGLESNAFTGADDTIYLFELPINVSNRLELGVRVLYEWAYQLSFQPEQVELEKGVVLGEMREYNSADDYWTQLEDNVMYGGQRYTDVDPLGTIASIRAATPDSLRAFYRTWYRPELMAVIVSGVVDAPAVLAELQERFRSPDGRSHSSVRTSPSPITSPTAVQGGSGRTTLGAVIAQAQGAAATSAGTAVATPAGNHPVAPASRFSQPDSLASGMLSLAAVDDGLGRTLLRLSWRRERPPIIDTRRYTQYLRIKATEYALGLRLSLLSQQGLVPWLYSDWNSYQDWGGTHTFILEFSVTPGEERAALESIARELQYFARNGASRIEQEYGVFEGINNMNHYDPSASAFTDEAQKAFLWGDVIPNRRQIEKLESDLSDLFEQGRATALGLQADDLPDFTHGLLSILAPHSSEPAALSGSVAELAAFFASQIMSAAGWPASGTLGSVTTSSGPAAASSRLSLPTPTEGLGRPRPASARITSESKTVMDGRRLVLSNGATVFMRPTGGDGDAIYLAAWSPGGASADLALGREASLAALALPGILTNSGLASVHPAILTTFLATTRTDYNFILNDYEELIEVWGSRNNLAELFSLVHALFTGWPTDPALVNRAIAAYAEELRRQERLADVQLLNAAQASLNPTAIPALTAAAVSRLTANQVSAAWQRRFGNAADFSFVVVGNFEPDRVRAMLNTWIGVLPVAASRDRLGQYAPSLPVARYSQPAVGDNNDFVRIQWLIPLRDTNDAAALEGLTSVLSERLFARIREELSATYYVACDVNYPYPFHDRAELVISFRPDDASRDWLAIVMEEIRALSSAAGFEPYRHRFSLTSPEDFKSDEDVYNVFLAFVKGGPYSLTHQYSVPEMIELAQRWLTPERATVLWLE
ncbi:MAG: hypothetical protein A2087_06870 [Spirochaetes bacterium GWD1_61_31]|nr:MAG: hypothetical protein A2Y37_08600 [Spirochaetes bacterium GWB1_60_80]OHD31834.1 MAG: hypothetical protein A2004_09975 [Spirochaetes bacterium GWC1_61_12]OHD40071.1 MAG: hypothetical protein A2087_06870 [Spirochaetes bacterium GWD1_61_31]OHD45880.1 MAG: hypothetical protein A2Y35_04235 [Spirochaetes bacterium GWE1_60_18]OHD58424.1 MAG: hypothetical protein A2Y32_06625 [Spirochaetes bacterium GWF1_60_12]